MAGPRRARARRRRRGRGTAMGMGLGSIQHAWSLTGVWRSCWGGWMEQCGAVVAGPRKLDLAGHGGRWKKGEREEITRRRGFWAIYRREESWTRGAASGEGRTGLGRLGGEVAERAGGELHAGAAWRLGRAPRTRVSVGRCQEAGQVVLESSLGSTWPRTRRGRGPLVAYGGRRAKQSSREGRDGGEGLSMISKSSGTSQ